MSRSMGLTGVFMIVCLAEPSGADHLRKAATAYTAGDFATCASYAAGLENSRLLNIDTALFLQAQCRFYSREYEQARKIFKRLAKRFPMSPHAVLSAHRAADCDLELGRIDQALLEYKQAADLGACSRTDPAVGLYQRAIFGLSKGDPEGRHLWNRLKIEHPDHPLVYSLPDHLTEPDQSLEETIAQASSLHAARKWEEALAVLDAAPEPANSRQRYQLAYRAGRIFFDMRDRYQEAAAMLRAARDHAPGPKEAQDAWFYYSRALGRLDLDDRAIASHLEMVRRYPDGRHAARALYYAGWLEQNQGRCDRAIGPLDEVLKKYPRDKWSQDARWMLAWCHIRQKQWEQAIVALTPQFGHSNPEIGGRALYWSGVSQASRGRNSQATRLWIRTIRQYPLTWYSLLARVRLGPSAPKLPPAPKIKASLPVSSPLLARAEELIAADLAPLAVLVLRHGENGFLASHKSSSGLLALLDAYRKAGDYNRPWLLSLHHRISTLRQMPNGGTRAFWEHSYPACARELLDRFAGEDPELVLFLQAIMRTESGFDPMALSVANARGLLQLYPPTASRVAQAMQIAYSQDILFEPEYNVRMAAWFLGRLVSKFRRQWPLAASAYNGGTSAMMKWCRENGKLLLDGFVESIPWAESRRYAQRVTAAFARYAWLEGAPLPELRLVVNADYLDDGIDY